VSDFKVDGITASTGTNTDLDLSGKGTGKVDIATGIKVGGTTGIPVSELRAGTDGELITWDASGNPATVAVGSSTHVLTSNGAGAAPTFQAAAAGGAWNIIGTAVASGSSSLTVTGLSSTYDTYAIALADMIPATDTVEMYMRFGDSSGVDSGASDYAWGVEKHLINTSGDSATYASEEDNADAQIQLSHHDDDVGTATGEGYGGIFYLHRPGDGTMYPTISGHAGIISLATQLIHQKIVGARMAVITLDRVNVLFSSGNITTGRLTVWGLAHA